MFSSLNIIVGVVLFVFSILYITLSFKLPSYKGVPVDSDIVPIVLGILLMVFSVVLFFTHEKKEDKDKQKKIIPENKLDLIMILIVGVLILIYIWLLERAGFLITTIFFLFVTTLVLGYRRHIVNLIVSISIPVVFYYSFSYLLEISLPKGILPF